jgi:aubergine-like protein
MEGMLTQFVTDDTLRKKNLQIIATKVLLQIIAKRGRNILWVPRTYNKIENKLVDCMLLGFDTAKGREGTVLASTAAISSTYSSLYTHCKALTHGKFTAMVELTLSCINAYFDRNKRYPKEIIIFFNSCTGDQVSIYHQLYFNIVMPKIKEILKAVSLTGIMVNVQSSERFFVESKESYKNVPAGTLINQAMVSEYYDFFLISQQSNRGSTVPSHYRVIFNESKIEEEALEELIYSQCFNYANWTGSIKVSAILQYAKKCAKFTADVFDKGEVAKELRGKPYFL